MRRFGALVVSDHVRKRAALKAHFEGSDAADLSGGCERPIPLEWSGHDGKVLQRLAEWDLGELDFADGYGLLGGWKPPKFRHVVVQVACRKCERCLERRSSEWRNRIAIEMAKASRTWFSTFTLAPEAQWLLTARADAWSASRAVPWFELSNREQYAAKCRLLRTDFQLYMKRVRKTAVGLRFCLVAELHKSGLPHLHAVIHETTTPVRHRVLRDCWTAGFSTHKLVPLDEARQTARYVAKYLTKSSDVKIVASIRYGLPSQ